MIPTILLAALAAPPAGGADLPPTLEAMRLNREHVGNAYFEWSLTDHRQSTPPLVRASRYAENGDWLYEKIPNAEGVTAYDDDGFPASAYAMRYMFKSDGTSPQRIAENTLISVIDYVSPWFSKPFDLRDAGLTEVWAPGWSDWNIFDEIVAYHEQPRDGLIEVTGIQKDGRRVIWGINPDKGYNPEYVQYTDAQGAIGGTIVSELEDYNGYWFPRSITSFNRDGNSIQTLAIQRASVGDPGLPGALGLEQLGIECGFAVEFPSRSGDERQQAWDGRQLISVAEYQRRRRAGELKLGPTVVAAYSRSRPAETLETCARSVPLFWEAYTREFIERYKLNAEQTQKAMSILKQANESAARVLRTEAGRKLVPLFEKMQRAKDQVPWDVAVKSANERMSDPEKKALAKLEGIFDRELKARLEKIPTRRQREAAEPRKREKQSK